MPVEALAAAALVLAVEVVVAAVWVPVVVVAAVWVPVEVVVVVLVPEEVEEAVVVGAVEVVGGGAGRRPLTSWSSAPAPS